MTHFKQQGDTLAKIQDGKVIDSIPLPESKAEMAEALRDFVGIKTKNKTMQDYWNDPPEYPDTPECCDLEMEVDNDGNCKCSECGKEIKAEPDIEPIEDYKCPHDGDLYNCRKCDAKSDRDHEFTEPGWSELE